MAQRVDSGIRLAATTDAMNANVSHKAAERKRAVWTGGPLDT